MKEFLKQNEEIVHIAYEGSAALSPIREGRDLAQEVRSNLDLLEDLQGRLSFLMADITKVIKKN